MRIYALFLYTYDYHEFEDFICVSRKHEKLVKYHDNILKKRRILFDGCTSEGKVSHLTAYEHGLEHYLIKEVEVV